MGDGTTVSLVSEPIWTPTIQYKICPKQISFSIPLQLLPTARAVFLNRYLVEVANRPGFRVYWTDQNKKQEDFKCEKNFDLNNITKCDPNLFLSRVKIFLGERSLLTITVYFTTGTVLVQGNSCKKWQICEFQAVTQCILQIANCKKKHVPGLSHPGVGPPPSGLTQFQLPFPTTADFESGREAQAMSATTNTTQCVAGNGGDPPSGDELERDVVTDGTGAGIIYPIPSSTPVTAVTSAAKSVAGNGEDPPSGDELERDDITNDARADIIYPIPSSTPVTAVTIAAKSVVVSAEDYVLSAAAHCHGSSVTTDDMESEPAIPLTIPSSTSTTAITSRAECSASDESGVTISIQSPPSAASITTTTRGTKCKADDVDNGTTGTIDSKRDVAATIHPAPSTTFIPPITSGPESTTTPIPISTTSGPKPNADAAGSQTTVPTEGVTAIITIPSTPSSTSTITASTGMVDCKADSGGNIVLPPHFSSEGSITPDSAGCRADEKTVNTATTTASSTATTTASSTTTSDGGAPEPSPPPPPPPLSPPLITTSNDDPTITTNTATTSTATSTTTTTAAPSTSTPIPSATTTPTAAISTTQSAISTTTTISPPSSSNSTTTTSTTSSPSDKHLCPLQAHYEQLLDTAMTTISSLQAEVSSLKDEMAQMNANMNLLMSEVRDSATQIKNNIRVCEKATSSAITDLADQTGQLEQHLDTTSKAISSLKECQQSTNREIKQIKKELSKTPNNPQFQQTGSNQVSPLTSSTSKTQNATLNLSTISDTSLDSEDLLETYNVSTSNHFSVLQENQQFTSSSKQPQVRQQQNQLSSSAPKQPQSNPLRELKEKIVPPNCKELLIGDSILCAVDEYKMSTSDVVVKNLSVPGLSVSDLLQWIATLSEKKHIQRVTVHIGINSCKTSPISTQTWTNVMKELRRAFPRADLQFSSLIPPFGKHHLKQSASDSTKNLLVACNRNKVKFINNTPAFLTKSGAPKKAMYKPMDPIHPSASGILAIGRNIYRASRPPHSFTGQVNHQGMDRSRSHMTTQQGTNNLSMAGGHPSQTHDMKFTKQPLLKHPPHPHPSNPNVCLDLNSRESFPELQTRENATVWGRRADCSQADTNSLLRSIVKSIQQALG